MTNFALRFPGRYRLKLAGYTVWMSPDYSEVSKGRRPEPITIYSDSPPRALRRLGHFDFAPDRSVQELEVRLNEGETIRPDASRLVRSRPPQFQNPLQEEDGMPGVAFQWLEVDGPLFESWPTPGHKLLFGDLGMQDDHAGSLPGSKPAPGSARVSSSHHQRDAYPPYERGTYTTEINELDVLDGIYNAHNQVPPRAHVRMRSDQPREDAERLLRNFLLRAYRRPVGEAEYARFSSLIHGALEDGHEFTDAMVAGYTAVLCSPEFLYHHSASGKLDGFALAERLSYFLWNSPPDNELRRLAANGELLQTETLKAQTDRMLDDPKSRRFVGAFLDYWLDLRNMTASDLDSELYPEYQLDDALVESMTTETQLFFQELIQGDLGIRNVVDSDFVLVNERLASLYEIDRVLGAGFRPVELAAASPRGGLITQASVLKVTSNGTTTSPVTRGAWVMERLLGEKVPPPPPAVQAIESDIRGATTIREQLALHRSHESCSVCHVKIDPAGFALESFDVMGGWRENYRTSRQGQGDLAGGIGHNGQLNRYRIGHEVDASGELPDGRRFRDINQLKQLLLTDQQRLARNLVEQLAIYATGAPIRFSDRQQINRILARSKPTGYGVRTLIHELVQSELFRAK